MPATNPTVFKITQEQYEELAEGYGGICLACGNHQYGDLEPDAENDECGSCGEMKVYGIEQALVSGRIEFSDDDE